MAIEFLTNINLEAATDIQFKNAAGANTGKIESDGNNLVLSNAVGDILLGDGASDIYIGDGTNSIDILFEVSGAISAESGATLTLGGEGGVLDLGSAISSAATILGDLTVGIDDAGHDVTFFGHTAGKKMVWDASADSMSIHTNAGSLGLGIFTSGVSTEPNFKVGRNANEWWGVSHGDNNVRLVHRQDEAASDGQLQFTSNEIWCDTGGNDYFAWRFGTNTGGSLATKMTLDKAGLLTVNGNADISGNLVIDGGAITIDPDAAGSVFTWKESDGTNNAGQLRSYANRGDIYLYSDNVKKTELSSQADSFIPALHIGGTTAASDGVLQTTGNVNIDGNADISGTTTSGGGMTVSNGSWNGLTITGSGTSHTQGSVVLKSSTSDTPEARGQGVFMFNEGKDTTWFMGTRYQNADEWQVGRATGTSINTSGATTANAFLKINNAGNSTFAGDITTSGNIYLNNNKTIFGKNTSGSNYGLLTITNGNVIKLGAYAYTSAATEIGLGDNGKFLIGTAEALSIDSSKNATFAGAIGSGAITSTGIITSTANSGDASIYINSTRPTLGFTDSNSFTDANDIYLIRGGSNILQFQWYDDSASTTTETFNITSAGNATFAGTITGTTLTGTSLDINGNADISGNVDFSTNNTDISMKDASGALTRVLILNSGNTMYIGPVDSYAGGGIIYGAAAGVSSHTFNVGAAAQLTLNSSNATFAGDVTIPGYINHAGDSGTKFGFEGNDAFRIYTDSTSQLQIDSAGAATFAGTIGSGAITSTGQITGTELEGTSLDINGAADISGTSHTDGIVRSRKNIVSSNTYNVISLNSSRTNDDYGGLNKDYMKIDLYTSGSSTDGGSSEHRTGNFSLKLANTIDSTAMGEVLSITSAGAATFAGTVTATNLILGSDATTAIGKAYLKLGDVSVVSYTRINADETVSLLSASQMLSAIGGGTSDLALGTTSSTALAGNTTVISSGQASAITDNTAKETNVVQTTVTGNAGTATKLAATKTIAGVAFDGSTNISLNNNAITNGAGYTTYAGPSDADEGTKGIIEIASVEEATAGSDEAKAVTAAGVSAHVVSRKVHELAAPTSAFAMNSQKITGVLNPTAAQDAATKAYTDAKTWNWNDITAGTAPTFDQNTTGSARTLTTTRAIYGNNFDGSAAVTGTIATAYIADDAITEDKLANTLLAEIDANTTKNTSPSVYGEYLKLIPSDFATNGDGGNTKFGVAFDKVAGASTYGVRVADSNAELFTFVSIPEGMKATHVEIYGKRAKAVEVFEVQINASTVVSKGTGTCAIPGGSSQEFAITNVNSTATNLLAIEVVVNSNSADRLYGGRVKIAAI